MVIVDTSVAVKWFFEEDGSDSARTILDLESLGAPDLLLYEFSNALVSRPYLPESKAAELLEIFFHYPVQFFTLPQKGFRRVLALSSEFKISAYDASFVALAESLQVDLITADVKLCQRTKRLPFVKLLS